MSKQTINIGASPNDGTGTPLRTSFDYTNQNFTELYTAVGPSGNNIVVPGNATITGDLTVRTTGLIVNTTGVGVNITPSVRLHASDSDNPANGTLRLGSAAVYGQIKNSASSTGKLEFTSVGSGVNGGYNFSIEGQNAYRIEASGVFNWFDGVGGTRMTLNSTGLGIGGAVITTNFEAIASSSGSLGGTATVSNSAASAIGNAASFNFRTNANFRSAGYSSARIEAVTPLANNNTDLVFYNYKGVTNSGDETMRITSSGNVGIGVTPTTIVGASGVNGKGLQGDSWTISSQGGTNDSYFGNNLYTSAYTVWSNRVNAASGAYYISGGTHIFYRGAAQAAGTITPTESARIDASGNLILQPSSTPPSLFANGQLTVNATSNTNLRFSYRGSDGTTRVANITLA